MIAENSSFALTNMLPSDIVKPEQKSKRTGKEVRVAPYSDEEPGESDSKNRKKNERGETDVLGKQFPGTTK